LTPEGLQERMEEKQLLKVGRHRGDDILWSEVRV
jgi:hypothetical protein